MLASIKSETWSAHKCTNSAYATPFSVPLQPPDFFFFLPNHACTSTNEPVQSLIALKGLHIDLLSSMAQYFHSDDYRQCVVVRPLSRAETPRISPNQDKTFDNQLLKRPSKKYTVQHTSSVYRTSHILLTLRVHSTTHTNSSWIGE